jgi:hypothetical protein
MIANEFLELIEDIPYVPLFIVVFITLWRLPFMIKDINKVLNL